MSASVLLLGMSKEKRWDFVDVLGRGETRYEINPSDVVPDNLDDYFVVVVWLANEEHDRSECARLVTADLQTVREIRERSDAAIIAVSFCPNSNAIGIQALRAGCNSFVSTDWSYVNWVELLRQTVDLWYLVKELQRVAAC